MKRSLSFVLLFGLLIAVQSVFAQANVWNGSGADNKWTTAANWSKGTVPTSGEIVQFNNTSSKPCVIEDLIGEGYVWAVSAQDWEDWGQYSDNYEDLDTNDDLDTLEYTPSSLIPVSPVGSFVVQSTYSGTITVNTSVLTATNSFTLQGGTFNLNGATLTVGGFVYQGGVFAHNGGSVVINNISNGTKTIASSISFYNLTIGVFSGANDLTLNITNSITVENQLTFNVPSGKTANVAVGTVNLKNLLSKTGAGSVVFTTATLNLNGTSSQNFNPTGFIFNNITTNNISTAGLVLSGAITASNVIGNLSVQSGKFDQNGVNVTLASGKNLTVAAGATYKIGAPATLPVVSGGGAISFAVGSFTVYHGVGPQTVMPAQYSNLEIQDGSRTVTFSNTGAILVSGTFTPVTNLYTTTGSSIVFNGVNQTIPAFNFYNLEINCTLASSTVGPVSIDGTLTLTNGLLTVGATNTLNLYGDVVQTGGAFAYNTSGTVNYSKSSAGQFVASGEYYNLAFSNYNKTLSPTGTIKVNKGFDVGLATGHTVTGSTIEFDGNTAITIPAFNYNNLTSSGSGSRVLPSSGEVGVAGVFTPGGNTYTVIGSTINFNGGAQTIPVFSYSNLTTSASSAAVKSLGGAITVVDELRIGANTTLNTTGSNYALGLSGNLVNNGAFSGNSSNVTFSGNALSEIKGTSKTSFRTLTLSKTSASVAITGDTAKVSELVNITSGGLTTNDKLVLLATTDAAHAILLDASTATPNGSVTGGILVQRIINARGGTATNGNAGYYSSPVSNGTVADFQANTTNFYFLNSTTQAWERAASTSTSLPSGVGFSRRAAKAGEKLFITGNPGNGSVGTTLVSSAVGRANMIGNPYPSPIDWGLVNKANIAGSGAAYLFNGTSFNTITAGPIGVGQGFQVLALAGASVTFTNASRLGVSQSFVRLAQEESKLSIHLAGNGLKDESFLLLDEAAPAEYNVAIDARKYYPADATCPGLALKKGASDVVIYHVNKEQSEKVIPLVTKVNKSGTYTFTFGGQDSFNGVYDLYLNDKKENTTTRLSADLTSLPLTLEPADTSRFAILLRNTDIATPVEDQTLNDSGIHIYAANSQVFVKNLSKSLVQNIVIYDVNGVAIAEAVGNGNYEQSVRLREGVSGVYIVKVSTATQVITQKVLVY